MNCYRVRPTISAFIDGVLPSDEAQKISLHLGRCSKCARERDQLLGLRAELRKLPVLQPPAYLNTVLRVTASRERVRQLAGTGFVAYLARLGGRSRLWMDNLMRPLALPLAGGLISAVLLLGMLVPTFYVRKDGAVKDVPFGQSTDATMKSMYPLGYVDEDLAVEVDIDQQGRMVDYSIPNGEGLNDPELRRGIENTLLFSQFAPARNAWGQPIRGPVRIYLRRNQVVVKG